ncbi:thymidine phosphorylase [Thalassotalea sp. PLHSN55]|uniref:thymidine phosphorylase n=1 Tax=Thalassotalea sp. PLHSN55 TaxID=3435888 RepID=UPI003F85300E
MLIPQEIIRLKRDGKVLEPEIIQRFVKGLVDGTFTDSQVGAMAMAIFHQGMTAKETSELTKAMMVSGDTLTWPEIDGPIVDKHSTGGVGDKVSFMLAAIVAACGVYVPMISGRGLGHTGGTADKLESISGFNVQPSIEKFQQTVKSLGLAIISQTDNLAPADKRLYGIRDVTATVESIPLITASILSKKLASGLDALVMDVKVGNGAMMTSLNDAKALASSIVNVANACGVKTQALITDMNQVLGLSAGNALEMAETVDYLTGAYREPRLHNIVTALATSILISAKVAQNENEATGKINEVLSSGKAASLFEQMIYALGGPSNFIEKPWQSMQKAKIILDIKAAQSGYINEQDTRAIGMSVVKLGGGRLSAKQQINHSVGFDNILPVGTKVTEGDVVARVHAENVEQASETSLVFSNALRISAEQESNKTLIYNVIS